MICQYAFIVKNKELGYGSPCGNPLIDKEVVERFENYFKNTQPTSLAKGRTLPM
jgi:hypothetical protein